MGCPLRDTAVSIFFGGALCCVFPAQVLMYTERRLGKRENIRYTTPRLLGHMVEARDDGHGP